MKIATTTGDFSHYIASYEDHIRELHRAGFRYIDLNMYYLSPESPLMQEGWQEKVLALKALVEELGMTFVQAHSPGGNPLWQDEARVEALLASTIRSIEVCQLLGIKNTVVHPGARHHIGKEEWFRLNKPFYEKLFPAMERCGVNVLCENSSEQNTGKGCYYLYTGQDMREFIEYVSHPQFGGCWDTGHANMVGSQYESILAVGDKLWAIHYNDNRGERDDHMMPFMGTMNNDEVIKALIDAKFSGYFTLECGCELLLYHRRRKFGEDDKTLKLKNPTLFMQQRLEALLYETTKWMLEAYELFEE